MPDQLRFVVVTRSRDVVDSSNHRGRPGQKLPKHQIRGLEEYPCKIRRSGGKGQSFQYSGVKILHHLPVPAACSRAVGDSGQLARGEHLWVGTQPGRKSHKAECFLLGFPGHPVPAVGTARATVNDHHHRLKLSQMKVERDIQVRDRDAIGGEIREGCLIGPRTAVLVDGGEVKFNRPLTEVILPMSKSWL